MVADIYIQINITNESIELIRLSNKGKAGAEKKSYCFTEKDSPITIGRHKSCKLILDHDNTLSRVNTVVTFNREIHKWLISDGNEDGLASTNGTWLYPLLPYEITGYTKFRYGNSNFLISKY
jgi:hypothetical protein